MKYSKPPLTYQQQADLLIRRGFEADKEELIEKLKAVNYYRLSGYWYPFRNPDDTFKAGCTLSIVWQRYTFDRQLRLLVLDAIERVEISVRTQVAYHHSHRYGAFGYTNPSSLPKLSKTEYRLLLTGIKKERKRSSEAFLLHYRKKYRDKNLPIWMAAEIMTFGTLLSIFRGLDQGLKQRIAADYGISDTVLLSWLVALNGIRNICAHHGRLWNRELGYKPLIPRQRKHPQWHEPVPIQEHRVCAILMILRYMLKRIAPQSRWHKRTEVLLEKYPDIPLTPMGLSANWRECPIWK